jgi:hypothetical protein
LLVYAICMLCPFSSIFSRLSLFSQALLVPSLPLLSSACSHHASLFMLLSSYALITLTPLPLLASAPSPPCSSPHALIIMLAPLLALLRMLSICLPYPACSSLFDFQLPTVSLSQAGLGEAVVKNVAVNG